MASSCYPKGEAFLWRIFAGSLPTKVELHRRHMVPSPICPLCGLEEETVNHALLSCSHVAPIWSKVDELNGFSPGQSQTWNEAVKSWQLLGYEKKKLALSIAWIIWWRRNCWVFKNQRKPDEVWISSVKALIQLEFDQARRAIGVDSRSRELVRWEPPPGDLVKINVDAGRSSDGGFGIEVVARDHSG